MRFDPPFARQDQTQRAGECDARIAKLLSRSIGMIATESHLWLLAEVATPDSRPARVALDWRMRAAAESSSSAAREPPERLAATARSVPIMTRGPLRLSVVNAFVY